MKIAALFVRNFRQRFHFLQAAEEVRMLHQHASGLLVDRRFDVSRSHVAVLRRDGLDFGFRVRQVRLQGLPKLGMDAFGHDHPAGAFADVQGHQHRFDRRAAAVVHAGVRVVHAGQFGDQRLILEHRLQRALAGLGLIRRVGGVKFAPRRNRINHRGNEMVVASAAQKQGTQAAETFLPGQFDDMGRQFHFAERRRKAQIAVQPHIGGHHRKQSSSDAAPMVAEHFTLIVNRVGKVGHGIFMIYNRVPQHIACRTRGVPVSAGKRRFVSDLHLDEPAFAVGVLGKRFQFAGQFVVHRNHLAGRRDCSDRSRP